MFVIRLLLNLIFFHSNKFALKELKSDNNIIVTKADKNGQIVLMDKKVYFAKSVLIYRMVLVMKLKKDRTSFLVNAVEKVIKTWVFLKIIQKFRSLLFLPFVLVFMHYLKFTKLIIPSSLLSPLCSANFHARNILIILLTKSLFTNAPFKVSLKCL